MQTSILSSTALLTLLLSVGLFFFIRASTKDRIEVAQLMTDQSEESLLDGLKQYFADRAYRVISLDAEQNQVTFEGFVRPSVFLAIFLSSLAAIGIFCLVLVLSYLFPAAGNWLLLLILLAPGAGVFYWKKSGRLEQVAVKVESKIESKAESKANEENQGHRFLTVTAHRDELAELRRSLNLKAAE